MMNIKRTDVPTRTKRRNLRSSSRFIDVEGVLSQELAAKLSPSIVWLTSYDGKELHSVCTGIAVRNGQIGASFVTSGDLITSGYLDATKHSDYINKLEIKVHLPNGKVANAYVQDFIVACNMLVVATKSFPDLRPACLDKRMQVECSTTLLAASYCAPDKFLVTTGVRTNSPIEDESHGINWSTCVITEVGRGGPLVDFDGNIVGMNLSTRAEKTPFVSTELIVKCMIDLGFWIYVNNVPTPFIFSSEGTSSLGTIISSSSQNVSNEGSENKNQEPCAFPNHGDNGVWCDLSEQLASDLSPRIVSLASFDGEALHSECTGIVIHRKLSSASFLTTGSLFGSLHKDFWRELTIMVRLPNNEKVQVWLQYYSGPSNLAVVITHDLPPSLKLVARLPNDMQVEPSAELLAVRRCFSTGKLMSTRGSLTDGIHSEVRKLSTCKIIEAASGGPLIDCDGNIVGINDYDGEQNPFLPSNLILKYLGHDIYWAASKQDRCCTDKMQNSSPPHSDGPYGERTDDELRLILAPWKPDGFKRRVNAILHALGYPLPSFVDDGMYLKWDFEEGFGGDNWNEPTRRVTSKMSRSVVALASFLPVETNDGKYVKGARKFACTGVFIENHESTTRILTSASLVRSPGEENTDPEWKIEVCLPSKRRVEGNLEYCNLQYNVAIVSINRVRSYRAAKLDETSQTEVGAQVVALGRGFESGKLMATNGAVIGKRRRFGHEELQISTCKITKAGIGGPLVDFDGNLVGTNFYDTEQTPYLSRVRILELMAEFNAERTVPVKTPDEIPSWPVPEPKWFYPTRYPAKPSPSEFVLE